MSTLRERVEWEVEDYSKLFPVPYSLSPRLQLSVDLLAALSAAAEVAPDVDAIKADAWDEGVREQVKAFEKWCEPPPTERMYWPEVPNPYRQEKNDE